MINNRINHLKKPKHLTKLDTFKQDYMEHAAKGDGFSNILRNHSQSKKERKIIVKGNASSHTARRKDDQHWNIMSRLMRQIMALDPRRRKKRSSDSNEHSSNDEHNVVVVADKVAQKSEDEERGGQKVCSHRFSSWSSILRTRGLINKGHTLLQYDPEASEGVIRTEPLLEHLCLLSLFVPGYLFLWRCALHFLH